jgi:hypothetical protein
LNGEWATDREREKNEDYFHLKLMAQDSIKLRRGKAKINFEA